MSLTVHYDTESGAIRWWSRGGAAADLPGIARLETDLAPEDLAGLRVEDGALVPDPQAATAALAAAWARLRADRDARLAACDWTQLPDVPAATAAAWAPYRQALRDLPAATLDPAAPIWPAEPA